MATDDAIFGPYFDEANVEADVEAALRRWLPTYLAKADDFSERQRGQTQLPKQYVCFNSDSFDQSLMEQYPAIGIYCTGMEPNPPKDGGGIYRVRWIVGINAVVAGATRAGSRAMARRYAWAICKSLIDHPSMQNPKVRGIDWVDRHPEDIREENTRMVNSMRNIFVIEYDGVMREKWGPATPDPTLPPEEEYPADPVVADPGDAGFGPGITITKLPINPST